MPLDRKDLVYLASGSGSLLAVALNARAAARFFHGGVPGADLCDPLTAPLRRAMWSCFAAVLLTAEWVDRKERSLAPHVHRVSVAPAARK